MRDDHDRGLAFDVSTILDRRQALKLFAGAGLAALVGCGSDDSTGARSTPSAAAADCETTTGETAGPYPGDGSNGPSVLAESGIVRQDIRSSFGGSSGTAEGVPLTLELTVLDSGGDCAALAGAAVYVWHCDRDGGYSLYSEGVTDQNYLRGVQETDGDGKASFTSIFPAAYMGRWPHVHFEVYPSLSAATGGDDPTITSQLALPEDVCSLVYATAGYDISVQNLAQTSLEGDNVFADGADQQLATVEGDVDEGFTASLTISV